MKANTAPLSEKIVFQDPATGAKIQQKVVSVVPKAAGGHKVSEKPSEKSLNDLLARFSK